ncbi:MAG: heat-inducible transcription repressor HrcA [Clostridia bacterium]|nr:heat-inducible transcription repressor HrcA [Clostridia bacterium]
MELTPRKQAILAAIVKYHIATGEPVGSKWLTTTLENAPSSATLRNEMSDLCTLGYLCQPHTSAGRVPTGKGYEFYVNSLMNEESLPEALKQTVDTYLEKASVEPESLPLTAAKILSSITGLPAFCAKIADDNMTVKRVEVIPMGERLVMMVVFTSDSRALSKLCKSGAVLTKEKLDRLTALIKGGIEGKAMWEMTAVQMQNLLYNAGANALEFSPIIAAIFDMIKDMGKSSIELAGESFLYSVFAGNSYKQELISFIERKEGILSLISKPAEKAAVIFGSTTGYSELDSSTLVVAPYGPKGSLLGRLGVIGPTRMSYGRILSSIAYVSLKVSKLMTENLEFAE